MLSFMPGIAWPCRMTISPQLSKWRALRECSPHVVNDFRFNDLIGQESFEEREGSNLG
jgi:hypothetical protein